MSRRECSVLIVGAGPVGLALAGLLLDSAGGERIALRVLEPRDAPAWDPRRMDLRVYALSRSSQRLLARLGVWPELAAARVSPYRRMLVWEGERFDGLGSLCFDSAELGEPDLGHVVEDSLIRARLLDRLRASGNAEVLFGTSISALENTSHGVTLVLERGERLHADLVVAADGSGSRLRTLAGLPVAARRYPQHALVTHVETEWPHRECARQRFLPGGPLAFLPLLDGRSSIVWSLPSARAEILQRAGDPELLAALQEASAGVLGELRAPAERAAFPLQVLHALRYCAPHIVLAGDAAHTVHPLAGQGMNLGLLDAACLARTITRALRDGEHPGDLRVLRRYERNSKAENLATLLALDALHHCFSSLPRWSASARMLALSAADRCGPGKRLLMRRALGVAGARAVSVPT